MIQPADSGAPEAPVWYPVVPVQPFTIEVIPQVDDLFNALSSIVPNYSNSEHVELCNNLLDASMYIMNDVLTGGIVQFVSQKLEGTRVRHYVSDEMLYGLSGPLLDTSMWLMEMRVNKSWALNVTIVKYTYRYFIISN